jgi:hypothetical protein
MANHALHELAGAVFALDIFWLATSTDYDSTRP